MRTCFVYSIHNKATIKALFKVKDDDVTHSPAIKIAAEAKEASKVAKETIGSQDIADMQKLFKQNKQVKDPGRGRSSCSRIIRNNLLRKDHNSDAAVDVMVHTPESCRFATAACHFCNIKGHIESTCKKKKRANSNT